MFFFICRHLCLNMEIHNSETDIPKGLKYEFVRKFSSSLPLEKIWWHLCSYNVSFGLRSLDPYLISPNSYCFCYIRLLYDNGQGKE